MKLKLREYILIFFLLVMIPVFSIADSFTFNTRIYSVSGGVDGLGNGFLPFGTGWGYNRYFKLHPKLKQMGWIDLNFDFTLLNGAMYSTFAWSDGSPIWKDRQMDIDWSGRSDYQYFNPRGNMSFNIFQGFGTDTMNGVDPLAVLQLSFNSRYALALERIDVDPSESNLVFIDGAGNPRSPFGPGTVIPGYPWLQDSRKSFTNYVGVYLTLYHYKNVGFDTSDGIYGSFSFEFGPDWLMNSLTIDGITSDFWKVGGSFTQRLALLSITQENGRNWLSIGLTHNNTLNYTGGDVVPENMLPPDRFRAVFRDSLALKFVGPQFIANDCYSEFQISLNNNLYFGHVANEVRQETVGAELISSIDAYFHLRLFGCLHFRWDLMYRFTGGIWGWAPEFGHSAEVYFYISL